MKNRSLRTTITVAILVITAAAPNLLFGRTDSLFNYRLYGQQSPIQDSLFELFKGTRGNTYGEVNGMAIMINGKLIGESYYGLFSNQTPFPVNSITKSIVSLACGICIEKGLFKTSDLLTKYLPEYDSIFTSSPLKAKIRISDLLNQTTGLSWDEWFPNYTYSYNALNKLKLTKSDWAKLALEQPMVTDPGVRFNYNSASLELLKKIVERTTKMSIDSVVYKNIFTPLGLKANSWTKYPSNGYPSWGGITMQLRDMAKLGQAILDSKSGKSNVLPKNWVSHILTPQVNAGNEVFYSYLFWHKEIAGHQVVFAAGLGDQYIYVVPSLNLIVAIAASNYYTTFPVPGPELILSKIISFAEQNAKNEVITLEIWANSKVALAQIIKVILTAMVNLKVNYLGLELRNPIIAGSSNLSDSVEKAVNLQNAGVGAIVFKSLFEEQIQLEELEMEQEMDAYSERHAEMITLFPNLQHAGPEVHLQKLRETRKAISIPLIASINAIYSESWVEYAKKVEMTGVDAIEINFYHTPKDYGVSGATVIAEQIEILKRIKVAVNIPISVKLSPYYANQLDVISQLCKAGADGVVLFNRIFHPDIDIEHEKLTQRMTLSTPNEMLLPLRFTGLLFGHIPSDICASTGITNGSDVVKMILAGATSVQVVSTVYKNKLGHINTMVKDLEEWMQKKGYTDIDHFRGKLSKKNIPSPFAYQRSQYVDILLNAEKLLKQNTQV